MDISLRSPCSGAGGVYCVGFSLIRCGKCVEFSMLGSGRCVYYYTYIQDFAVRLQTTLNRSISYTTVFSTGRDASHKEYNIIL